jgi:hypothetical protein
MRALVGVFSIFLISGFSLAPAAETEPSKHARVQTDEELRAEWLKACANDWDAETHMTKKEWDRVCQRVTSERMKFRSEQQQQNKKLR